MGPPGDPHGEPLACVVVRGAALARLGGALGRVGPRCEGPAVVLVRLSPPTPVSAALVGALADALLDAGCPTITVGGAVLSADLDRGHTSVAQLAEAAGLDGRTPSGRRYTVADLLADTVPAPVPSSSVLHGAPASRAWSEASVRVVVGRLVTDLFDGYAATLATLAGAAPEVAGAEPADVVTDLLEHLPPALVVLDALSPAVGVDGARLPTPLDGDTLVIGTDPVLVDGVGAALLGQDRAASRLVERAVARLGPPGGRLEGDTSPLPGVVAAHPLTRAAARSLSVDARLERVVRAAVGPGEPAVDDPVLGVVSSVLTPLVASGDDAAGQAQLAAVLGTVGTLGAAAAAWRVAADKDAVDRRVVPLGFDPRDHPLEEYDALPAFFGPFDDLLDALAPNADGMRWTLVDGATVFEVARDVRATFDDWVRRVDVAEGISLMADYLGGRRVEVGGVVTTSQATSTRQAERNLYLPQPNYLAAWGGQPIDVGKVELVERGPDRHRLTWRTVVSPNRSATFDDGSLTFERSGPVTRVVVRGRQLFALPPAWAGVDLELVPEVRGPLLEEAYRRFFTTTFDNLEACFEGRDFRIGREPSSPTEPLLTRSVEMVLRGAREWFSGDREPGRRSPATSTDEQVDEHGFVHVRGPR